MSKPIPARRWTRRHWDFSKLKVGGELLECESPGYFRAQASRWFRKNGREYTTFGVVIEGRQWVKLVRTK